MDDNGLGCESRASDANTRHSSVRTRGESKLRYAISSRLFHFTFPRSRYRAAFLPISLPRSPVCVFVFAFAGCLASVSRVRLARRSQPVLVCSRVRVPCSRTCASLQFGDKTKTGRRTTVLARSPNSFATLSCPFCLSFRFVSFYRFLVPHSLVLVLPFLRFHARVALKLRVLRAIHAVTPLRPYVRRSPLPTTYDLSRGHTRRLTRLTRMPCCRIWRWVYVTACWGVFDSRGVCWVGGGA